MTTEREGERCSICGIEEYEHAKAEALRTVNHRWNTEGQLIQLPADGARRPASAQVVIANAVDMQLRRILLDKGVLTHEDFAPAADHRAGTAGDLGSGEAEGTG